MESLIEVGGEMGTLIYLPTFKEIIMILVALFLIYISIIKKYEPLLLLPIGIGILLVNLPFSPLRETGSIFDLLFKFGIKTEVFPLLIFISIGAMIDFKPLIEKPWMVVFGIAGQFGIFGAMIVALLMGFTLFQGASIGIIGSADGPTSIFVTSKLAPEILGPVTLAAYSYMALVPLIQPPIMRILTTKRERRVKMDTERVKVTSLMEKVFPYLIIITSSFVSPMSIPLVGFLMFGNILSTSGVTDFLAKAAKEYLSGIVTLFLGVSVGSTMKGEVFLTKETLLIFLLGLVAFSLSTVVGVLIGKVLRIFGLKVNPLIGAAGLSSFPMSARLVHQIGREENKHNFLLMHAIGANTSGQIASVVAGGVLLELVLKYGNATGVSVGLNILLFGMLKVFVVLSLIGIITYILRKLI